MTTSDVIVVASELPIPVLLIKLTDRKSEVWVSATEIAGIVPWPDRCCKVHLKSGERFAMEATMEDVVDQIEDKTRRLVDLMQQRVVGD